MGRAKNYIRTVEKIVELIENSAHQQLSTREIYDMLASGWTRYAPTRSRLTNILSKSKRFEALGNASVSGAMGKAHEVKVWGIRYEASTDN